MLLVRFIVALIFLIALFGLCSGAATLLAK